MISSRHAAAVVGLLLVSLVPTVVHSYLGLERHDGRRAGAVPEALAGMTSVPSGRNAGWGLRRFDSPDWFERNYTTTDGGVLKLFVGRSYDAKKLYHHPELAVAYGTDFAPAEIVQLDELPGVPLHVLRGAGSSRAFALYALHYGESFVGDPFLFQLRLAGQLLVGGRRPMTLFFVQAATAPRELEGSAPVTLLAAAVSTFLAQAPAR